MMDNGRRRLTAAEAAARLGVKRETLYAYVSRGQLTSRPAGTGRGSVFDAEEVDALLRRSRVARQAAQELTVETAVSSLAGGQLRFRGHDALTLARTEPYESVATLLWTGELRWQEFASSRVASSTILKAVDTLPTTARMIDRLRVAVDVAAVHDPLRFDLSAPSVVAAARRMLGLMPGALRPLQPRTRVALELPGSGRHTETLATRLWCRLSSEPPSPGSLRALNGALVVLADHELATSTFAARVAASVRANPYAVVGAGLGALDGQLHGQVSELVHQLFVDAEECGVEEAVGSRLRHGDRVPGFGQGQYPNGDPRAPALLEFLEHADPDPERLEVVHDVRHAVEARTGVPANVDFGLGALLFTASMPPDAGEAIFAIARCAGWIAHALEEYQETPLRFRLRAREVATNRSSG